MNEATIEEIKSRIDIAELISSYGIQIKHVGASLKACCPFHHEKTPSFNINQHKGYYHCFGCGESGDAIKFVMKMEGSTFIEAATKLANQCGIKIEEKKEDPEAVLRKRLYALMAELAEFYHRCLRQIKEASIAREYLEKRHLSEEVQDDFLIGYAPNGIAPILKWAEKHKYTLKELEAAGIIKAPTRAGDQGYHRFGGRLMFSIKDKQGRVVAFSGRQLVEKKNSGKYVNSPETLIFKKSNVLFGFDRAASAIAKSPTHEVICCEGQIDTIRLHISGWPVAVASQGTAFTEEHAKMINRVADAAILMYDDDGAGRKATIRVAQMLLQREMPVRVVSLPDGNDPDSFLLTRGADALKKCINDAESIISFQCRVERAKEANPNSIDAVSRIAKAVLTTLSMCPSPILCASLTSEASHILNLPIAALNEELVKIKESKPTIPPLPVEDDLDEGVDFSEVPEDSKDEKPILGDTPEKVTPPPGREMALMEFLMANEYEENLSSMIENYLPTKILLHEFTIKFLALWRKEIETKEPSFPNDSFDEYEKKWFSEVLFNANKMQASALDPSDAMRDFIRLLWCDYLMRCRGALPANGDGALDLERMKLSLNLKRLQQGTWKQVKEIIQL